MHHTAIPEGGVLALSYGWLVPLEENKIVHVYYCYKKTLLLG